MKNRIQIYHSLLLLALIILPCSLLWAQDSLQQENRHEPARKAFGSPIFLNGQTDVVNIKKTLEFDIQHRFGTLENGANDLFGIFAPSNIRLGLSFTPLNRLAIGVGISKIIISNPTVDYNLKFKIFQQARSGGMPVNLVYYGDMGEDTRGGEFFTKYVHRFSFFHELIISRRFNSSLSAMVAPMVAHFNSVDTLYSNDIFGLGIGVKYRVSPMGSVQVGWTQPLNQHDANKAGKGFQKDAGPKPEFALGYEVVTSSHCFQIFFSTYRDILPQNNLVYNTNTLTTDVGGKSKLGFLVGFNITRLWNF